MPIQETTRKDIRKEIRKENRMKRCMQTLVVAMVGVGVVVSSFAQGAGDASAAQNKLLAQRAARVDAIRKLSERINGLQINSNTLVKDFVTESDEVRTAMSAFLNGMREKEVRYEIDGTCSVTMEVTLVEVVTTLTEIRDRYYKGSKFKGSDFTQISQTETRKVLTEVGSGVPRQDWYEAPMPITREAPFESPEYMSSSARDYWLKNVQPNGRLGAVQAARVDAMRRLVERIVGTQINSKTLVRDFVTEKDEINAFTGALLRGAREVSVRYYEDEPIVEVEMAVTLETIVTTVKSMKEFQGNKAKVFEESVQKVDRKEIVERGMGVVRADLMKVKAPAMVMETAQNIQKWPAVLSETGSGAISDKHSAAQGKLMARRAAELDARRKLAERINGLEVRSRTYVKDFVTENDEIATAVMAFQQGVYVIEESFKDNGDGTVEITVAVDPEPLWSIMMHYGRR